MTQQCMCTIMFSPEGIVRVHPVEIGDQLRQRQGAGALEQRHAVREAVVALHSVEVVVVRVSRNLVLAGNGEEGDT